MSEKTRKFDNIRVNKNEFHKFKQPINLDLINADQIVVSDKSKHNDHGYKYFIGYKEGEIVKPLCIIFPQMTLYIKNFENVVILLTLNKSKNLVVILLILNELFIATSSYPCLSLKIFSWAILKCIF